MPDYWMDTSCLIAASRGPYSFTLLPRFWELLGRYADEGVIASSTMILEEIIGGEKPDKLALWAAKINGIMFVEPDEPVQSAYRLIAGFVYKESRYDKHEITNFLDKADPWLIAHALAKGGQVVTFEAPSPFSKKPKIPDVAKKVGVTCVDLYQMLNQLGASL